MKNTLTILTLFLFSFFAFAQDFHEQFKGKLDLATSYFDKGDFDNFKKQFELSNVYLEDVSPEKLSNEELNLYTLCLFRCVYQGIDNSEIVIKKSIAYLEYNKNDEFANLVLAFYYQNGIGFTKDINKAKEYYLKSIELGSIFSMVALGNIYENEKNYDKAIEYYQKAVNTNPNDKDAMNAGTNLGWLLYNGYGTNVDKEKAIKLWEELANYNCGSAVYKLSYHYFNLKNYIKSKEYLEKGILLNNKDCFFSLGDLYEFGYNTIEIDKEKARQLYEKGISINRFYHYGYYKLGNYYKNQKQYSLAITYFEKAIELGSNQAMVSLGYCYEMGYGLEQSYQKAFDYYNKSANLGNINGIRNVGICYRDGIGTKKNIELAEKYFSNACDKGVKKACEDLSHLKK